MTPQDLIVAFDTLAEAPDGVTRLRELVLQLAVRGHLVPQDPNDEPSSVLLERLSMEKASLVTKGVIRRPKRLPPVSEGQVPFEVPEKWAWTRLGELVTLLVDGSHNPPRDVGEGGIPMLSGQNVRDGSITLSASRFISEADFEVERQRYEVREHDVLVCIVGSIGRSAVVPHGFPRVALQRSAALVRAPWVNAAFLSTALRSPMGQDYLLDNAKGTAQLGVYLGTLATMPLPIPPLAEQHRIVVRVDDLMSLLDRLEAARNTRDSTRAALRDSALAALRDPDTHDEVEAAWQRIAERMDDLFNEPADVDPLRQIILQLAMRGRLVPQDPSDEPACALLERVAREKARFRKEEKIRTPKGLPTLSDLPKPFDLPPGWEWSRLADVGELSRGRSKHRPRNDPLLYSGGTIPLVQTGDVARANWIVRTFSGLYNELGLQQSRLWPAGTMCITIAANIADTALLGFDACFPDSVVGFRPFEPFDDARFFAYFMRTAQSDLEAFAPSTAQKNINLAILDDLLVPLPPLGELARIVLMLDQLMNLLDQLADRLARTHITHDAFAAAAVHHLEA